MFDPIFHTRFERVLSALREADTVSVALLGRCLSTLKHSLAAAEVDEAHIRHFSDLVLDCHASLPAASGRLMAERVRALLEDVPGLGLRHHADSWSDSLPKSAGVTGAAIRHWDIKEFDNCLGGLNRASLGRLRKAMGLEIERRVSGTLDLLRHRDFPTCGSMKMADRHDAGIDGEQIDRLIRRLGLGGGGSGPYGGRPAVIG